MKRLPRILAVGALAAATVLTTAGTAAAASPQRGESPPNVTCSATLSNGTYGALIVPGGATCTIPINGQVTITGGVQIQHGAILNAMTSGSTVTISGTVLVQPGALLKFGCSTAMTEKDPDSGQILCPASGGGPGMVSHDTVDGNIVAIGAKTMYVDNVTVHGNLISIGGGEPLTGQPMCEQQPPFGPNLPIKDNTIDGNVLIAGWHGCWFGYVRNIQHGTAVLIGNRTDSYDSTEVVNNDIQGNLICAGNSPAPQIGDTHQPPSRVSGLTVGQCRHLPVSSTPGPSLGS